MTRQELGMLEAARTACLAALQAVESVINRDDTAHIALDDHAANPWGTFDDAPSPNEGATNGTHNRRR